MKRMLITLLFLSFSALAEPYYYLQRTYLNVEEMDLGECSRTFRYLNKNYADCMMTLKGSHNLSQITHPGFSDQTWYEEIDLPGMEVSLRFSAFQPNTRTINEAMTFHVSLYYNKLGNRGRLETLEPWRFQFYFFEKFVQKALAELSDKEVFRSIKMISLLTEDSRNFRDDVIGEVRVGERYNKFLLSECQKTFENVEEDYGQGWFSGCSLVQMNESHKTRGGIPLTPEFWSAKIHRPSAILFPCTKEFALLATDSTLSVVTDYQSEYSDPLIKKSFDEIQSCLENFLEKHHGYHDHFIYSGDKLLPGEKASGRLERVIEGRKMKLDIIP